jgi:hypothetical protein
VGLGINMQIADDYLLAKNTTECITAPKGVSMEWQSEFAVNVPAGNIRSWFHVMSSPHNFQRIRYFCFILQQDFCPIVSK